ncbi:MAG: oxidative damage protection protein [Arsenophonus endosymbiont of Ceratovacuna japonica]
MSRIIFCTFLQRKAKGMDFQCYPGELGKQIFNQISKEAWNIWITKQTILINEKKLNTINPKDIKLLKREMIKFLFKI